MNKQLAALTLALVSAFGFSGVANAASISGQGTWETTLQGRDLDGNMSAFEAYYDTALDITWLADTHYAGISMDWATASAWVSGLNIGGYTGWRLPTIMDTGASGCDFAYTGTDCGYNVDTATGEMAHMFYDTLGNKALYDTAGFSPQPGWGLTNTGPFFNFQRDYYWSATGYALNTSRAWIFHLGGGLQDFNRKTNSFYAWAVHTGDVGVAAIPVPAAAWLFGSGLLGMVGVARRNAKT